MGMIWQCVDDAALLDMSRGHDFAEGVAAFLQKRPAVFTDR
jgi:enoyl-CoA hydratase/carnithine racemase